MLFEGDDDADGTTLDQALLEALQFLAIARAFKLSVEMHEWVRLLTSATSVTAVRKEAGGRLDLEAVQRHIDGIASLAPRLGEIITKVGAVQKSGEFIEEMASAIKDDIDARAADVLRLDAATHAI